MLEKKTALLGLVTAVPDWQLLAWTPWFSQGDMGATA